MPYIASVLRKLDDGQTILSAETAFFRVSGKILGHKLLPIMHVQMGLAVDIREGVLSKVTPCFTGAALDAYASGAG